MGKPTKPKTQRRAKSGEARDLMAELGVMGDQVRCQEALRVLLITALDIIEPLKEKLDGYLPDGVDPHGMRHGWHAAAVSNLRLLLSQVIMRGPY